jgi:hypothetical protein
MYAIFFVKDNVSSDNFDLIKTTRNITKNSILGQQTISSFLKMFLQNLLIQYFT